MTTPTNDAETTNRIVSDLDANLLVEAGAGTGKTYALVSRVVALIKSGKATMRGIVAITFTEAAAAELSERIRSRMEQLLDPEYVAAGNDPLLPISESETGRIRQAIDEIDQASIQTIHSFASQILRERPIPADLPPGWATLDAIESNQQFADAWDNWLDNALGQDGDAELQNSLRYLLGINIGVEQWRPLALSFSNDYDRLCNDNAIPDIDLPTYCQETLAKLQNLENECSNTNDRLYQQLAGAIETVQAVADVAGNPIAAARALNAGAKVDYTGNAGAKNNWRIDTKEIRDEFRSVGANFQVAVKSAPMLPLLRNLRQAFAIDYPARRKADGVATFEDLLVWSRDVLRDDAEARAYFQQKYSHILIDEFQDTDPLQAEMAFYLAAQPNADVSGQDWHTIPLHPGKLFIVGDAKQSIYRFRRADIGVTQLVKDSKQMESLTLSENRRSQKPVLDWVNAAFSKLMIQDSNDTPPVQAEYIKLHPNAETQQPDLGTAQFFGEPSDDNADQIRRHQAANVAALIAAATVGDDIRNVYDKDKKCIRQAGLGDVCILIRSRTGLNILERELESANIPYRIEGGSLLFNTQEVRDLLNCLRAIDNPSDEVSVVAALRSPAFACSDVDLLQWRDAGGRWNYSASNKPNDPSPVADAMSILEQYHHRHQTESVAGLIADFIRNRRLDELDLAEPRPREMWRRRQFLVAQARNQEYNSGNGGAPLTLRRFIDWAETQQHENARIAEIAAPETDDESVRIMTMHAAKGLEFPIVILLGFDSDLVSRNKNALFGQLGTEVEVSLSSSLKTPGYDALSAIEKRHADAESIRLAYVATTRARDQLLVSLHHKRGNNSLAARITEITDSLPYTDAGADAITAPPIPAASNDVAPNDTYNPDWQTQRNAEIANRSRPQAVTATSIAKSDTPAPSHPIDDKDAAGDNDHEPRRGRGGRSGTAFGSALHAVLQQIVEQMTPYLPRPTSAEVDEYLASWNDEIARLAQQQTADKGISHRNANEIARLAQKALSTSAVTAALCAPNLWSEIPVAAPITTPKGDVVVIEGIIDLLYQDADGELVVIDYKSDDILTEPEVSARLEHYQWQGAAYAAALESATGKTVKDVQFLFVRLDNPLRQVKNLRELMSQLPAKISAGG